MTFNRSSSREKVDSRLLLKEFRRFFFAGGLAFLSDFTVFFSLTHFLRVHYLISNLFGFSAGLLVSYLLSIKWVFQHRKIKKAHHEFVLFAGFALLSFVLNELLLWFFVQAFGIYYLAAKILATGATFLFNFSTKKLFLFSSPRKPA
ncbi:MAG: GtrA family protein [Desulfuromonadales bacterium]|jgi:putative flippase GtrA